MYANVLHFTFAPAIVCAARSPRLVGLRRVKANERDLLVLFEGPAPCHGGKGLSGREGQVGDRGLSGRERAKWEREGQVGERAKRERGLSGRERAKWERRADRGRGR